MQHSKSLPANSNNGDNNTNGSSRQAQKYTHTTHVGECTSACECMRELESGCVGVVGM